MLRRAVVWIAVVIALGVAALWVRPFKATVTIEKASARPSDSGYAGEFIISLSDLKKLMDRDFSVRPTIFDCGNVEDYYPADALINGVYLDDSDAVRREIPKLTEPFVSLSFSVPARIYNRYKRPCLTLSGGQMVGFSQLSANTVPIQ